MSTKPKTAAKPKPSPAGASPEDGVPVERGLTALEWVVRRAKELGATRILAFGTGDPTKLAALAWRFHVTLVAGGEATDSLRGRVIASAGGNGFQTIDHEFGGGALRAIPAWVRRERTVVFAFGSQPSVLDSAVLALRHGAMRAFVLVDREAPDAEGEEEHDAGLDVLMAYGGSDSWSAAECIDR